MGYKFQIEYKTGASNKVVDALSRRDMEGGTSSHEEVGEPEVAGDPDVDAQLLATLARPVSEVLETLRREAKSAADLAERAHNWRHEREIRSFQYRMAWFITGAAFL